RWSSNMVRFWNPPRRMSNERGNLFGAALGQRRIDSHPQHHAPAPVLVRLDQPMWGDLHGLMDQLKASLRLAYRLDRQRPEAGRPAGRKMHVQSQPLVDQPDMARIVQCQPRLELTEPLAVPSMRLGLVVV